MLFGDFVMPKHHVSNPITFRNDFWHLVVLKLTLQLAGEDNSWPTEFRVLEAPVAGSNTDELGSSDKDK